MGDCQSLWGLEWTGSTLLVAFKPSFFVNLLYVWLPLASEGGDGGLVVCLREVGAVNGPCARETTREASFL